MSSRDLFNLAEACIENEDMGQAKDLIQQAIALGPTNEEIISRAVVLLVYAELYSSARKVYEDYQKRAGLKLPLDFTYENIIHWEQDNSMVDDVPVFDLTGELLHFKMLQDVERGGFPSFVSVSTPIKEINISAEGLIILQAGINYAYKWSDVTRATITIRRIWKGRGSMGVVAIQKIFTLEMSKKKFQFDVSATYPDFKSAALLRAILIKYLNVEEIDEMKSDFGRKQKNDPIRNIKRNETMRILMIIIGFIVLVIVYNSMVEPNSYFIP